MAIKLAIPVRGKYIPSTKHTLSEPSRVYHPSIRCRRTVLARKPSAALESMSGPNLHTAERPLTWGVRIATRTSCDSLQVTELLAPSGLSSLAAMRVTALVIHNHTAQRRLAVDDMARSVRRASYAALTLGPVVPGTSTGLTRPDAGVFETGVSADRSGARGLATGSAFRRESASRMSWHTLNSLSV